MFDTLKKKEGRPAHAAESPGQQKDGPSIFPYPVSYPKPADNEVDDSIWGCYENYKTEYQEKSLDSNKEKKGR